MRRGSQRSRHSVTSAELTAARTRCRLGFLLWRTNLRSGETPSSVSLVDFILLAVALGLLVATGLLLRDRRRSRREEDRSRSPAEPSTTTSVTTPSAAGLPAESRPQPLREFMLAGDGQGGARQLQIQVLEDPEAGLFAKANASTERSPPSVALQPILSGLPEISSLISGGSVVRILNPGLLRAGEMTPTASGLIGVVRDTSGKDFVGQLRFSDPTNLAVVAAPAVVFVALSAVTGQYYLNRINKRLGAIERGMGDIEQSLRNAVYGDIMASSESCRDLEHTLERTGALGLTDRVKLDSAESRVDAAYFRLEKDLLDFRDQVGEITNTEQSKGTRKGLAREALSDARGKRLYDVQLFVFACAVRHKLNLLNLILSEVEVDPARLALAAEKVSAEQKQMTQALREIQFAFSRLAKSSAKLDGELWLGLLDDEELSDRLETVRATTDTLGRSQSGVLPAAPRIPAFLEARLSESGTWTVATPPVNAPEPELAGLAGDLDKALRAELARRTREQWGGHP